MDLVMLMIMGHRDEHIRPGLVYGLYPKVGVWETTVVGTRFDKGGNWATRLGV